MKRTLLIFTILLVLLYGALHLTFVQNWLVHTVARNLSEKLHTKVSLRHIDYHFFDKMDLAGLLVEDQNRDTLLYAGSATVNISDWFFLKNKPVLKYMRLDDARINMHREDSVWNYQFIVDYFSGPKKTSSSKSGNIEFDLKIVQLNNVQFIKKDAWVGVDMKVAFNSLDLHANEIDFNKKKISITSLSLKGPFFSQNNYTGNRTKWHIPKRVSSDTLTTEAYKWNNEGWVIHVNNIHLEDGAFQNDKETERAPYTDHFDGQHLLFTKIAGDLRDVHFEKDTVTTFATLSTKEKCGFEVKKLQASIKFTPDIMEFNQLDLRTNKSRLGNYYAMKYSDFEDDMSDFISAVKLEGRFINSELSSDDLTYFAPELKEWKRTFTINGTAKGTIDNLSASKMVIRSGKTLVDGEIDMKGLPDISNTYINFTSRDLQTTYADLSAFIPTLKNIRTPRLDRLGNIRYKGNFTGFLNDFVAFGTINTNLGTVTGDINMKLPDNMPAAYLGKVSTTGFALGSFIDNKQFGNIAFDGKLNGKDFRASMMQADFDGNIRYIDFAGYGYRNILLKGSLGKKIFNGLASINDPNLQVENLQGIINLGGKVPAFNFTANLQKADFKNLGLTSDDYHLKGKFALDFTGNNIDNFLGTARITGIDLSHNNKPLSLDSLILRSEIIDDKKYLSLQSNVADASVQGSFRILELPDAFRVLLNRYYPAYIAAPSYAVTDQEFNFSVKTKEVDDYVELADTRLKGFNNSEFSGEVHLNNNQLTLNAQVPVFSYDDKVFNNIRLKGEGNIDSLRTTVIVDEIVISDSLHLPATRLSISSHNDLSDISIITSASKTLSSANINAQVQTLKDGVRIHFYPTSFMVNDKKWELKKDGELLLTRSMVSASEVKFINDNQEITISTEPSELGNSNDVVIDLKKISLEDFTAFVMTKPQLEGLLSGSVRINDPFGKPVVEYHTQIEQFKLDHDSLGTVDANGNYYTKTGVIDFTAASTGKDNNFNISGSINTKDTSSNQININLVSQRLNLSLLNNYLGGIFTNIQGFANTSGLKVSGSGGNMTFSGIANIEEGALTVNYTQCRYHFKNEKITFNPNEIDFGMILLYDSLKNTASLEGKMYFNDLFQDIEFNNIHFNTNKLLVLNTTKKDNAQFYGKVIGNADMTLNGPVENMIMNITGEPSKTDSSHIYLQTASSVESSIIDYIEFIQFGSRMDEKSKGKTSSNILVNMILTANTACKIDVILDETTGDIIKGEGSGVLKISVGNKEPLTINGRYEIARGEYTFNFQTFLKKYFTVNSGSIVWQGDPYQARIDILAEYLASNIDFGNLSGASSSSSLQRKGDLRVVAHLTETLLKPLIDFEFLLPDASPLKTDIVITKRLAQFRDDKNELNKQVTSLLLFNSFISDKQSFLTAGSGYSVLSSTIGGVVSNALSNSFSKLLQRLLNDNTISFNINFNSNLDLQNNITRLQGAAKANITKTFFNSRLIITVGGNFDYNNPYITNSRNTNLLVTPDITAEWLLTRDGRVRLVGFNRTNYDIAGQRKKTGISVTYRKDVDKLSQLFGKGASKRKKQ